MVGAVGISLCTGLIAAGALLGHAPGPAPVSFQAAAAAAEHRPAPRSLVLVVAPHPDDELTAWPALQDVGADSYTVFVTLTRGEHTRACRDVDRQVQAEHGERMPHPRPAGLGHPSCGHARLDSWWSFLEEAGRDFPAAASGPTTHLVVQDGPAGRPADVWAGESGARVALTLSDGAVSSADAAHAVGAVLALRGDVLPDLPVERVVLASYWNDSPGRGNRTTSGGGCAEAADCPGVESAHEYEHADHRGTARAVAQVAAGASAETWLVVPPGAGEAARRWLGAPETATVREAELPAAAYERLVGQLHRSYGWLSYPDPAWATGDRATAGSEVLFARRHDYLVLPGGTP